MSTPVKVAAAQLAPILHDRERTIDKAVDAIHEASRHGARLVAFPEAFIPGYPYFALLHAPTEINAFLLKLHHESVEVPSPATERLGRAAREASVYVVMGLHEREGGTLYNSQLIIAPDGEIIGKRRKLVPTSHERLVWGRGDGADLAVFPTVLGTVGGLICYEHANALFRYAIQAQGEQIHIATWPGGIPSINGIIDAATRHYAFEGQTFVLSVTSVLTEEVLASLGEGAGERLRPGGGYTAILSPRGDYLAGPHEDGEVLLYGDLDFDLITKVKTILDTSGHYARPDVVRLEIDRTARRPLVVRGSSG